MQLAVLALVRSELHDGRKMRLYVEDVCVLVVEELSRLPHVDGSAPELTQKLGRTGLDASRGPLAEVGANSWWWMEVS